jgi:hypothetical protein
VIQIISYHFTTFPRKIPLFFLEIRFNSTKFFPNIKKFPFNTFTAQNLLAS